MARRWTRPLFQTRFPGPEISTSVKRSIGAMDLQSPALLKIRAACERLKLKYETPFYLENCCAHIAIPSVKLAIWLRQSKDSAQWARVKAAFEGSGWRVIFTTTRQIEEMRDDELSAQIKELAK